METPDMDDTLPPPYSPPYSPPNLGSHEIKIVDGRRIGDIRENVTLENSSEVELRDRAPSKVYEPTDSKSISQMQRKCKKCGKFYTNLTKNGECRYHPGKFVESTSVLQGSLVGWSCCRIQEGELIAEAVDKKVPGCKTSNEHEEDVNYSKMMAFFPFDPEAKPLSEPVKVIEKKEAKEPSEIQQKEGFWKYQIQKGDTLVGISLKFGVSVDILKIANHLQSHQIFHLNSLWIPNKDRIEDKKLLLPPQRTSSVSDIQRQFINMTDASEAEANYYLKAHSNNLTEAVNKFNQDQDQAQKKLRNMAAKFQGPSNQQRRLSEPSPPPPSNSDDICIIQ